LKDPSSAEENNDPSGSYGDNISFFNIRADFLDEAIYLHY
jgi:hypothetical protein